MYPWTFQEQIQTGTLQGSQTQYDNNPDEVTNVQIDIGTQLNGPQVVCIGPLWYRLKLDGNDFYLYMELDFIGRGVFHMFWLAIG